ncbi:fumonisin cluster-P450 monooxygenase [Fusarium proliferatum ET1]|uniref:Fumonisin cluster-P450 monooxygenase n=1 Tax=Fusarium proliferatum (strain ET1) TaxID=1227346 RepID=A0A1L7W5L3_FUSPR|nr:fumonisin cluster-P450 monooxygenase [Fusarium proliferatum ET1]CZR47919.1 fumonisin cluster-P450 monooxygenase [Fusarium proliferatum ET1]
MYHIEPIWDARSSLCLAATIVAMLVLIGIGVIMYNIFLHPASKFPGPTIAGATSLRYHWAMSTGNVAPWLREQHARYGEIVRIAPDMISYVNPDAWRDIYAYKPGKKEQNGIDWTIPSRDDDVPSMFSEANDAEHNRVRRLFLPAFSDRALKQQEPLLSKYSDQLIDLIRRGIDDNSNQEFDAVKLYNFTTFDIMGDLTFGEPLGLLKNSSYTEWVQNLFHDIKTVGIFLFIFDFPPLPWLVRKFSPPSIQRAHEIHKRHTVERVNRRLERGLDRPDIWNLVLSQPEGRGLTRAQMHANADIFMIAGTETTATLLSGLTYLLLKNPEKLQKLVKEIRGSFGSSEELTVENLARLPYLSACLSEGLRCYPPVPIGPSRLTPKTGADVLGEHIPGRIRLTIPQCAAYYSELNFKDPYSFTPERWLPDTGYENDRKGILQPFLIGPRNCIGQNLSSDAPDSL